MMDFRRLVEMECARLACDNIYDSTYAEMEGCIDALEQGGDPEEQVYQFHYRLTQASGNGIYSMFFRAFEPVIRALIKQHYSVKAGDVQASARLHRRLLAAIKAKDEQQAVSLTREILSQGVAVLEEMYGSNDGVCKRLSGHCVKEKQQLLFNLRYNRPYSRLSPKESRLYGEAHTEHSDDNEETLDPPIILDICHAHVKAYLAPDYLHLS